MSGIVAALLVGGRSRRMGREKALIEVGGMPMAERAAQRLQRACGDLALVGELPTGIDVSGRTPVADRLPDGGPLVGVEAALAWAAPRSVLVLACDLPAVDRRAIDRLLEAAVEARAAAPAGAPRAWVAASGNTLQPLAAVYASACLAVARRLLEQGERSMRALTDAVDVVPVPVAASVLLNVNSPADLARVSGQDGG